MNAGGGSAPIAVIAHRGASRECPENTIAAFDEALRQGCDAIELDLQLSRDGVAVVYHDRTLTHAGGGRRRVAALTAAELRRLRGGARFDGGTDGAHIPTLEQVLRRYAGRTRLLLEIKIREGRDRHLQLARELVRTVRAHGAEGEVSVLCFDGEILDEVGRLAPRLPRVLNVRPLPLLPAAWRRRLDSLQALSADVRTLTWGFAAQLQRAGCPLLVFTCNTRRRVELARRAGAVGIMSDRPGWLAAELAAAQVRE